MTTSPLPAGWRWLAGARWLRIVAAAAVLASAIGSCASSPEAAAKTQGQVSTVPTVGLTTDGTLAMAVGPGNVLYLGGGVLSVGTRTGHWVRYGATGARDAAWPEVDGGVNAAVPDGAGGWFLGGEFSHVGGQPRARLAHVDANGALDPMWSPSARDPDPVLVDEATVEALCVVGDTVYVGGSFSAIDGEPRENLAAVDAVNGDVRPWNPRANDLVRTLAAVAGNIYAGGNFTQIGAERRQHLAAFDAATGALTAWNPGVIRRAPSDPVSVGALTVDRGTLYVGGLFNQVAGRRREGIAAFDLAGGALTAWNPGTRGEFGDDAEVDSIVVAGDTVYVGGFFDRMGGTARASLAAVDAHTGRALPWRADVDTVDEPGSVNALALVGDRLYVGGLFERLAGRPRPDLGVVSATSAAPAGWNPRPNGEVRSLVAAGDALLVGGGFSGVDGQRRNKIAAIDLGADALLPFRTHTNRVAEVGALAARDHDVFAGGYVPQFGLHRQFVFYKIDARSGQAQPWEGGLAYRESHSSPLESVNESESSPLASALAVRGRRLYVGGRFIRAGGRRRHNLVAFDTRTGQVARWRADANGVVSALVIHGQALYVAGDFTRIDGHRRRGLAAIDRRSGHVTAWNPRTEKPSTDGGVTTLAIANGRVYLGGSFRHVGGHRRSHLAAVNLSDGRLQPWRPRANAPVTSLAVIAGTVYAGGEFTSISGAPRKHLAAIDGVSGALTPWNPDADCDADTLLATRAWLIAGGCFDSVGGTSSQALAIFPPTP